MKRLWLLSIAFAAIVLFSNEAKAVDINAGPIWNHPHAQKVCPGVCASRNMNWNGHWKTTVPNKMSVCGCIPRANPQHAAKQRAAKQHHAKKQQRLKRQQAVKSQHNAKKQQRLKKQHNIKKQKAAKQAASKRCPRPGDHNAGPIWNQGHAQQVCPKLCASLRCSWTGHWRTTIPSKMSVCNCK